MLIGSESIAWQIYHQMLLATKNGRDLYQRSSMDSYDLQKKKRVTFTPRNADYSIVVAFRSICIRFFRCRPNERTMKPHPHPGKKEAPTINLTCLFFNVLDRCFNNYPVVNPIHIGTAVKKQAAQGF